MRVDHVGERIALARRDDPALELRRRSRPSRRASPPARRRPSSSGRSASRASARSRRCGTRARRTRRASRAGRRLRGVTVTRAETCIRRWRASSGATRSMIRVERAAPAAVRAQPVVHLPEPVQAHGDGEAVLLEEVARRPRVSSVPFVVIENVDRHAASPATCRARAPSRRGSPARLSSGSPPRKVRFTRSPRPRVAGTGGRPTPARSPAACCVAGAAEVPPAARSSTCSPGCTSAPPRATAPAPAAARGGGRRRTAGALERRAPSSGAGQRGTRHRRGADGRSRSQCSASMS